MRKIVILKDKSLKSKIPVDKRFINYDDFIKFGLKYQGATLEKVDSNADSVIAYTGGTTGESKGVITNNKNLNAMIVENATMGYDVQPGDRC